jgi:hypothetical protein
MSSEHFQEKIKRALCLRLEDETQESMSDFPALMRQKEVSARVSLETAFAVPESTICLSFPS